MDKFLDEAGEFDYDYKNDILFFKVKDREYARSVELASLVIDFDEEDFIVGLQIINASEIFQMTREVLRNVRGFRMQAKITDGVIQINLSFNMISRNSKVEYKPIIFDRVGQEVPNSQMICMN